MGVLQIFAVTLSNEIHRVTVSEINCFAQFAVMKA